jgi:preprotein translocase subunit SecD
MFEVACRPRPTHRSALLRVCTLNFAISLASIAAARAEPIALGVAQASVAYDMRNNAPIVTVRLTPQGQETMRRLTTQNVGRKIDVRVDGKSMMKPVVREPILGGTMQILTATEEEARSLAGRLTSGRAKLELEAVAE